MHRESCSSGTRSCHGAGEQSPEPSLSTRSLARGEALRGPSGGCVQRPTALLHHHAAAATLTTAPRRRARGSKAELCWAPGTLQDTQQLKDIPKSTHFLQVTKPLSPAVPPQAGNPGIKHMSLTTRFQFVLTRQGKNSSQSRC